MALVRWDPFAELDVLRNEIDRLFSSRLASREGEALERAILAPAVDIKETDNEYVFTFDLPGVSKDDIQVQVEGQTLTVRAERKFEDEKQRDNYHRIERFYGQFQRLFTLPDNADADKMTAKYENGVLRVVVPKKEERKPKTVKVQ